MKFSPVILLLPSLASAFPGMIPGSSKEDMLKMMAAHEKRTQPLQDRGLVGDIVGGLLGTINGILGGLAQNVKGSDRRPEPGFEFKAPGPNDSRGPCPALNLLANYGYLPRDGFVTFGQVVDATARGFNMGTDLATVLATFSILTDGDFLTETWYLGTDPKTKVGGLNRHSTVEADVSPNKEDYYLGCGDNHHISSRLFKQNVNIVAKSASKQFDIAAMGAQYALNAEHSKKYNPYLYYFPFPSIVSVVAYNFYPRFFSNGTFGAGGVANYESISSIIGAKYNPKTGEFEYVPERWPDNWYRRATPFTATVALLEGFTTIYPRNPIGMPIAQLGTPNLSIDTILCDLYMGLNSITPLYVAGGSAQVEAAITWAIGKIQPQFKGTILGCPSNSYSKNFLYPYANRTGGPLNPPPAVEANAGNNVYGKIYFKDKPTKPLCSHTTNPKY